MSEADNNTHKTLFERIRIFVEKNREGNLRHPSGWHDRVQNIYVSHHRIKDTETGSANQWQKYSAKK